MPPGSPALIEHRYLLVCETVSSLRHGSGLGSPVTDRLFRTSADQKPVIGGTSIAGLLRMLVESLTKTHCQKSSGPPARGATLQPCQCPVCQLFGDVRPMDPQPPSPSTAPPAASRVWVYDTPVVAPNGSRVIDAVAINRQRRAADDARKFDQEEIPAGAMITLDILGERLSDDEQQWLESALRWLAEGQIGLGGGAAVGSGLLKCHRATIYRRDLSRPDHLLASLQHDSHDCQSDVNGKLAAWPEIVKTGLCHFSSASHFDDRLEWTWDLKPNSRWGGTFLVADNTPAVISGWDRAPRGLTPSQFVAELPSRSVRGALRSGAERILNTIHPQGTTAQDLCDKLFGSVERASRLRVQVTCVEAPTPSPWDHVAIDRFTGGASDGRKFDALVARGGRYKLTLSIVDAESKDLAWMKGLLALTLRDLHEGRITIGHGSAKGHGFFELFRPDAQDTSWISILQPDKTSPIQSWIDELHSQTRPSASLQPAATEATAPSPDPSAAPLSVPASPTATALKQTSLTQTTPSSWSIRCGQCSIDELVTVAEGLSIHAPTVFLESATRCVIRPWRESGFVWSEELAFAWHFRLFGENAELVGRRIELTRDSTIGGNSQWSVRLVASDQLPVESIPFPLASFNAALLEQPKPDSSPGSKNEDQERKMRLIGITRTKGDQFEESRYARAESGLKYPGKWNADTQAQLCVRRFSRPDGDLVCWVRLEAD